jgi:hypothetical protein
MNLPKYDVSADETFHIYQFKSHGPKGQVLKGILFSKIHDDPLVYNLALGDVDPITGKLNDQTITDNKDSDKIFATVGEVVMDFCNHHIGASILADGNTLARKRLYQMQVSSKLSEVQKHFIVYGITDADNNWEIFVKNKAYQALLVKPI